MNTNNHLLSGVVTAFVLFSWPVLRGEPVPTVPSGATVLSMSDIVSDLEKRGKAISSELSETPIENRTKPKTTVDHKRAQMVKAGSEIFQCLAVRGSFVKHTVIPTDPLYRAIQRRTLADLDLQTALVWWQYCKEESLFRSLQSFDELPLATQLKSEKEKADAEFAKLSPKPTIGNPATVQSDSRIKPGFTLSNRLVQSDKGTSSVLDQLAGWSKLSEEEKSKIIAR
jgi:hypothetical protein